MSTSNRSSNHGGTAGKATVTTSATTQTNFAGFTRLGAQIYLHKPQLVHTKDISQSTKPTNHPDLLVLCTWMGAQPRPIAKYISGHLALHPNTPILLIRSELRDIVLRGEGAQITNMKPAAEAIRSFMDEAKQKGSTLKVLFHIFSNGGSWSACMLKEAFASTCDRTNVEDALPVSAMVIDSAPSLPHPRLSYNAMMQALPKSFLTRTIGGFVIWFIVGLTYVLDKLRLRTNIIIALRKVLNDTNGPFLANSDNTKIPRTYICGQQDAMVPLADVLAHAAEAREIVGSTGVEDASQQIAVEEFSGMHVGHMLVDPDRYWKAVQETWLKSL